MEIDVSKCMDYNSFCYKARQLCKDVDSKYCIHKQLQQLKAELQAYKDKVKPVNFVDSDEYLKVVVENKQLKAENEGLQSLNDFNVQKIETLEAENEELKEKLEQADEDIKAECTRCALINKLEQCLDEIEGIAKGTCRKRCTNDCLGTKKHCGYGEILQKISEVEDER